MDTKTRKQLTEHTVSARTQAFRAGLDERITARGGRTALDWTSAHNLLAIVRSNRQRGGDVRALLQRLSREPGTIINPQARARYARKWLARMERA